MGPGPNARSRQASETNKTGELINPDFAALAVACGAKGARVEKPGDFKGIFEEAIRSNGPFVIDVAVNRQAFAPSTGTWVLPPFGYPEPSYGKRNLRK